MTRRIAPALAVALAFIVFSETTIGRRLEWLGFDALSVRAPVSPGEVPVVIVGIDEPSFAELDRPWPWPRSLHARLIDQLKAAGAAVIAFDVVFAEPSNAQEDVLLARAIQRAGNVVLASDLEFQDAGQFQMVMPVEPIPLLRQAGARSGVATISVDPDLVVRAIPQHEDAFWRQVLDVYRGPQAESLSGQAATTEVMARYLGPDHSMRYVSYYQALDPEHLLPPGIFAGKIVLIGHDTKVSLGPVEKRGDAFATPYSALTSMLTPGVEIQATFVANKLFSLAVREAPRAWSVGLILIAMLLMGAPSREWHAVKGAFIALALAAVTVFVTVWCFASRNIWLPALSALLAVAAMYVAQVAQAFLLERRRRHQIEKAFRHYVAPEIVAEMTAHPERLVLGGVRRDVTIMFTDLAGFTRVSETLPPEQVSALLNEYLTHMTGIVLSQGGTVDKFIGDAIMAFWGAPLPDAEQALHACQAADGMQRQLAALRADFEARGLPPLRMRIGIHSGAAVVGNMGSNDRFDYTAVGDNVNLASRLEGINKLYGTDILLSHDTAKLLAGRLPLRHVDRVVVQGRTQSIDIFTICEDEQINRLSEAAFEHYAQQHWDEATSAYQAILARRPGDPIAIMFLARIQERMATPAAAPWDGSVALEKM